MVVNNMPDCQGRRCCRVIVKFLSIVNDEHIADIQCRYVESTDPSSPYQSEGNQKLESPGLAHDYMFLHISRNNGCLSSPLDFSQVLLHLGAHLTGSGTLSLRESF